MITHTMRRPRWAIAALALGVFASLLTTGQAGATSGCGDSSSTLKLTMNAARASYARGEVAKIRVRVTREFAGYETDVATAGTEVVVFAQTGDVIMYGGGTTDERGKAIVKVKVKRIALTGPADGSAHARREVALGPCFDEEGHVGVPGLFRITR